MSITVHDETGMIMQARITWNIYARMQQQFSQQLIIKNIFISAFRLRD